MELHGILQQRFIQKPILIKTGAFEDFNAMKTINEPAKKANYYMKRPPENLHLLIVELPPEKKAKK